MRLLVIALLVGLAALLIYAEGDLPDRGDPQAPANTYVSPHYLARAEEEVGVPNVVTAVLADYRSYDTLGETVVVLTAGMAMVLIIFYRRPDDGAV